MKKIDIFYLIIIATLMMIITTIVVNPPANSEILPEGFEITGDFAFYSKYVSRGFTYDTDPVLQSGIYLCYKGVSLSVWNSLDIRNQDDLTSDEIDYVIEYTYPISKLSLTLGHSYFDCPGGHSYTKEFTFAVAYDCPLSPSITWMHDYVDEDKGGGDGDYVVLDLSKGFPLKEAISLDLSGHLGYNSDYYIDGAGGDIAITIALSLPLNDKLICSPSINYSVPFGDLSNDNIGGEESRLYGGIMVRY